jgi:hypothetical protein
MVSLPKNHDDLNSMLLHIDIELIEWVKGIEQSKKGLFNLRTKSVKISEVVEDG